MEIRYDLKPRSARRQTPFRPEGALPFGQLRTDHMFLMDYEDGAWLDPRIPYGESMSQSPSEFVDRGPNAEWEGVDAGPTAGSAGATDQSAWPPPV